MTLLDTIKGCSSNGSHVNNPYHNPTHCSQVTDWCIKILKHEHTEPSEKLLWAAMFHDYNHSGGTLSDDQNIIQAKQGVSYYYNVFLLGKFYDRDFSDGYTLAKIHEIIDCTMYLNGEFPHSPRSLEQEAIRDADLMSIFLPTEEASRAMHGLYQEILVKNPNMTKEEFWENNVKFLSSARFYTNYAKSLLPSLNRRLYTVGRNFLNS